MLEEEDESGRRVRLLELKGKAPRVGTGGVDVPSISEPAEPFRLGLGGMKRGAESLDASLGVNEYERVWTWVGDGAGLCAASSMTGADIEMDTVGVAEDGVLILGSDGNGCTPVPWLKLRSKKGGAEGGPPGDNGLVLLLLRLRYWAIFSSIAGETSAESLLRSSADFDHARREIARRSPSPYVDRSGLEGLEG